jgi:hypothetical protein
VKSKSLLISFFSLFGIYIDAPKSNDMGTQIARIPIIDVNKSNLTFFCLIAEDGITGKDSSVQYDDILFSQRRLAKFDFSDCNNVNLIGTLNDRDCALTLALSQSQWNATGLGKIVPEDSNLSSMNSTSHKSPNSQNGECRKIKIFIKRNEYKNFVKALVSRNILLEKENDNDDFSSSASGVATLGSFQSKFSVRKKRVRNHIEFSTRISNEDPEKFRSINHQLKALHQPKENDSHQSQSIDIPMLEEGETHDEEEERENITQREFVKSQTVVSTPSPSMQIETGDATPTKPLNNQNKQQNSPSHQLSFQTQSRLSIAEVTPIVAAKQRSKTITTKQRSKNVETSPTFGTRLNFDSDKRPLDLFSAICCSVGTDKAINMTMNTEDQKILDNADTIFSLDEAMKKASNSINELHHLCNQLNKMKGLHSDTAKCIDWIPKFHEDMQRGSQNWKLLRKEVDQKLLGELLNKKEQG